MSTAELVIVRAIDHFNGNTSSHVRREEVLVQRRYRLLLLDHEIASCGNNDGGDIARPRVMGYHWG